jgi:hypothetical protein
MSRLAVLVAVVVSFTLCVASLSADDAKNEPKTEEVKRLSADVLKQRVQKYLYDENPNLNPTIEYSVNDITTDAVWNSIHVQVVKLKGSVVSNRAFVVRQNDLFPIGASFGGSGVTSLVVADLNQDGKLLFFSFAWGSGDHRSQIAAVDCQAKEPKPILAPLVNFSFKDYTLKAMDGQTVEVWAGREKIGQLALEKKEKDRVVQIRLDEKIPEEIKQKLKPIP